MFSLSHVLYDKEECENRIVRAMINNPKSKEHVTVAYDSGSDPLAPSLVAVWNHQHPSAAE